MRFVSVDNLITEGNAPEVEILSILDVPQGKMGRVIGRKGASILSIKESCKYMPHFLLVQTNLCIACFISFRFGATNMTYNFYFYFCSAEILVGGAKGPPDKVSLEIS